MSDVLIIGICGKMGSGKDYVCNNVIIPILQNLGLPYLHVSLADQIKVNVMTKQCISFSDVYERKTDTTRTLLQMEGTELGRNVFGKDIWINYLQNWIRVYSSRGIKVFICTDIRFQNELDWVTRCNGITIRVKAPYRNISRLLEESCYNMNTFMRLKSHISECDLDTVNDSKFDFVIYNEVTSKTDQMLFDNDLFKYEVKKRIGAKDVRI